MTNGRSWQTPHCIRFSGNAAHKSVTTHIGKNIPPTSFASDNSFLLIRSNWLTAREQVLQRKGRSLSQKSTEHQPSETLVCSTVCIFISWNSHVIKSRLSVHFLCVFGLLLSPACNPSSLIDRLSSKIRWTSSTHFSWVTTSSNLIRSRILFGNNIHNELIWVHCIVFRVKTAGVR